MTTAGSLLDTGPLNPMPAAAPRLVGTWLGKLAVGCAVSISALVMCLAAAVLETTVPRTGALVGGILSPIVSLLWIIAAWLVTTGEPGDRKRLKTLRWISRIAALLGIPMLLLIYVWRGQIELSWLAPKRAYVLLVVIKIAGLTGAVFFMQYLAYLSQRLGDRTLRRIFIVLKWLAAIMLGVVVAGLVFGPAGCPQPRAGGPDATIPLAARMKGLAVSVAIFLSLIYVTWRLYRRLLAATRQLVDSVFPAAEEPPA